MGLCRGAAGRSRPKRVAAVPLVGAQWRRPLRRRDGRRAVRVGVRQFPPARCARRRCKLGVPWRAEGSPCRHCNLRWALAGGSRQVLRVVLRRQRTSGSFPFRAHTVALRPQPVNGGCAALSNLSYRVDASAGSGGLGCGGCGNQVPAYSGILEPFITEAVVVNGSYMCRPDDKDPRYLDVWLGFGQTAST